MNQVKIDIMAFRGAREAWPAHVYQVLREAGFRLKPLDTADPSHEQVAAAIEAPWRVDRNDKGVLLFRQGDPGEVRP